MSRALVIIEAPGKIRRLEALLAATRRGRTRVVATGGHIADFPERPDAPDIDWEGATPGRRIRAEVAARLRSAIAAANPEEILIATDDDEEGDVIAWDLAELLGESGLPLRRLRLGALTREALEAALARAEAPNALTAAPGMTRAIADRLLGFRMSCGTGCAIGRVLSPLLSLARAGEFRRRAAVLAIPRDGGGPPFRARLRLDEEELGRLRRAPDGAAPRALAALPPSADAAPPPAGTGWLLLRLIEEAGLDLDEAEATLQRLYEAGRLSYCRAEGRPLPPEGVRILARSLGWTASVALPARPEAASGHPAPYPLEDIPLASPPERLDHETAALVLIGRAQAEAVLQAWSRPAPADWRGWLAARGIADGAAMPAPVAPAGRPLPWLRGPAPGLGIIDQPLAARVLEAMLAHGLGRPSTFARHVRRLLGRGLLRPDGGLTPRGEAWLDAAPPALREPAMSRRIEEMCRRPAEGEDGDTAPWRRRFARLRDGLPPALREAALNCVERPAIGPPRPR